VDKSLTSAPVGASEQAFHAMVARSREEPPAGLAERLARLDGASPESIYRHQFW